MLQLTTTQGARRRDKIIPQDFEQPNVVLNGASTRGWGNAEGTGEYLRILSQRTTRL